MQPTAEPGPGGARLCFVSHTGVLGGAERTLVELARGFCAAGAEVHVLLPVGGELEEALLAVGARTRVIAYGRWTTRRTSLRQRARRLRLNVLGTLRVRAALRDIAPDVVMTNTMTVPAAAFAARWLGLPHVWFVHEFGREDHGLRFDIGYSPTLRLISRLSAEVIVPSRANRDALAPEIPPEQMSVIYYMPPIEVDLSRRVDADAEPLRAVIVGAVKESKGQADAIEALGELATRDIEVRLAVVGDGKASYVEGLRARAAELGVADRVDFAGFADPHPYFDGAHVGLMCSRQESLGKATVEAMMHGCAVIGAKSGGTPELISADETGLFYEPGDGRGLADQLERLARDRALCERLGRAARDWAFQTYRLEDFTQRIWEVMRRAQRPRSGGG
jgi:glycosyltransferase involved in cell wall biosynthesis